MSWAHYLLQVNIYLIVFFCFYKLLLDRETYFVLNRIYLMLSGILSLAIPFLRFEWFSKQEVAQPIYVGVDQLNTLVAQVTVIDNQAKEFNWGYLIVVIYLLGILFCVGRLIYQLLAVKKLFATVINGAAFSFFRKKKVAIDLPEVATVNLHEDIHIKQLHTVDVLFFEFLGIFTWFNPIIYIYKKTIKNIHEYLADEAAAKFQGDKEAYALLLLSQAFGVEPHTLTNRFFTKSLIKKRIFMLHKQRSKKTAILKYGLFVPLFALMLVLSSATIRKNDQILAVADQIPLNDARMLVDQVIERPLLLVDQTPPPAPKQLEIPTKEEKSITAVTTTDEKIGNSNWSGFYSYLIDEIKYPAAAIKKKIQGNTIINFTIRKGKITDAIVQNELGEGCDEEVIQKILAYDDYFQKDGTYSLKVTFKLDGTDSPFKNENVSSDDNYDALANLSVSSHAVAEDINNDQTVYSFISVETPPTYPGGLSKFYEFLGSNIKYPTMAIDNDVQGNVFVSFTVEKDGSLSDLKVERKLGYGTDEEAIRVLKSSKKWAPGMMNGRPIRVKYNIPIRFSLDATRKENVIRTLAETRLKGASDQGQGPAIIVDSEIKPSDYLKDIDANTISTIKILKEDVATTLYGKNAGKNGAVVITTKKQKIKVMTGTLVNKS